MATVTLSPGISALIQKLKSELRSELKRKPAVEETPEMDVDVWSKLPQELLMRVLSHLPTVITRNFIVVCKSWRSESQEIQLSVPLCLSPAFLIGGLNGCWYGPTAVHNSFGCVYDSHGFMHGDSILHHLYLLQSLPTYPMRKLTLDFLATCGRVVTTCKSLICYRSDRIAPNLYSICNPITRTWKSLPPPIELRSKTDFIAMSFDPCARRCLLVIGVNKHAREHRNQLVMEIFDSQSSTWTKLEMDLPLSICPKGEGLYSRRSFYWINYTPLNQSGRPKFRFDVAAYKVAEKRWDVIRQPKTRTYVPKFEYEHRCSWRLTGYDGKVVLVDQVDMSLWKLNIEGCEGPSWSEFQAFPRSPYKEIVSLGNIRRADRNPQNADYMWPHPQILINSCEWVLVHLPYKKLIVFDEEGRIIRSIEGKLFSAFGQAGWRLPLHTYEINNVWWP